MRKKEDMGYGIVGVFLLVSMAFFVIMSAYEPITAHAVSDVTGSFAALEFFSQNLILVLVVFILLCFSIGGAVFLIKQHNERQRILENLPSESLDSAIGYIKSTLAQGFSKKEVKSALMQQGWQEDSIDAMLHDF